MKGKKDILRRVCEGGNVVTREIDEVSDGGNTMQDKRGRDGVSIRQNQNITEDMLEGFTVSQGQGYFNQSLLGDGED